MSPIRASLLASGILHALVIGGVGWFAAQAAGRGLGHAEILVQVEAAPDAIEACRTCEEEVRVEIWPGSPALAEPRLPEEWFDPRQFASPPPASSDLSPPAPEPRPAAWFARARRAPPEMIASPQAQPAVPDVATPAPRAPVVEVIPGENPPPDYPWLARRRGLEGLVAMSVAVDAAGIVTAVEVVRSSGHELLDTAAVRAVRAWRFRHGPGATVVEIEFALRAR